MNQEQLLAIAVLTGADLDAKWTNHSGLTYYISQDNPEDYELDSSDNHLNSE